MTEPLTEPLTATAATAAADAAPRLPRTGLLAFAGGSIGMGVWVTVPGLLLLYFLTDVLAVSPLLAGFVLLLPKIVDVILHPFVGNLSDADFTRRGSRRRLMLIGCALPFAFAAMFAVPGPLIGVGAAAWVAALFIAGNLLFAAYQVPYLATPADLRIGYHERTRLMAFRMVVLTVGILLSGVLAPIIVGQDDPSRSGYVLMGSVLAIIMLSTMVAGIGGVRRLGTAAGLAGRDDRAAAHGLRGLLASLRDRQFRWLVGAYLVTSTATHLVLAAVPYYAEYELGRTRLTTVLMAAFLVPALVATPVWLVIARRLGKQRGLLVAQATFTIGCLVLALGRYVPLAVLIGAVGVLGTAFAALQLLAFSMLPDVVNAAGRDGVHAGNYTGAWTAADATGGALGPYLYAACLALGGFVASSGGHLQQSESALAAVRYGFGLLPAVLMLVAFLLQRRYTQDRQPPAAVLA